MTGVDTVRVLLLGDTHIGFDLPLRPRVERRRRGHDFLANLDRALRPALAGEVDVVVHGGDVFNRSRVRPEVIEAALLPLVRVAERNVPVFVVPGNHERRRIPRTLLTVHPNLHVFGAPCVVTCEVRGLRVALAGFPFERRIASTFREIVERTGGLKEEGDVRLLCMHQTVEGARVGPSGFTFRRGADVIPGRAVPAGFAAVLTGHIHRAQHLRADLGGRPLAAPVVYPGSVERTSFAERDEAKGYAIVDLAADAARGGRLVRARFEVLPTREMVLVEVDPTGLDRQGLTERLRAELSELPEDAVVRLRVNGDVAPGAEAALGAADVRALAPPTMNVSVAFRGARR